MLKSTYVGMMVMLVVVLLMACQPVLASPRDSVSYLFEYRGRDTTAQAGWYFNGLGDINNDGFSDIAVFSYDTVGSSTLIFYGGNPADTIPDLVIPGGWGPASAIDLDGDGIAEVVTSDQIGHSPHEVGYVHFYKGYADSIGSEPYFTLSPDTGNWAFGWELRTGFVDSDSLGDLLVLKSRRQSQQLVYYCGAPTLDTVADWSLTVTTPRQDFDDAFGFIDFNGDGQLDIFAAQRDSDPGFINIFYGPDFGTSPDLIIHPPADLDTLDLRSFGVRTVNLGDFDGDGFDDLGVRFFYEALIYCCGPHADTLYDYRLEAKTASIASAGDLNGDGCNDLISGGSHVMDGSVQLYLGGTEADIFYDRLIIRTDLPPWFLDLVGYRVSTAGDFNGDGIDDPMFACRNFASGMPGAVFIIEGSSDILTGVYDNPGVTLPLTTSLNQNYPNPFNPSTTIEFSLSTSQVVSLEILNMLGQPVKKLITKKRLRAGDHSKTWDGTDTHGHAVATGVYLYRLRTTNEVHTQKMLLIH